MSVSTVLVLGEETAKGGERLTEAASLREERSTDGRFLVRLEIVLAEPKHDGRFADGRLACVVVQPRGGNESKGREFVMVRGRSAAGGERRSAERPSHRAWLSIVPQSARLPVRQLDADNPTTTRLMRKAEPEVAALPPSRAS